MRIATYGSIFLLGCALANAACAVSLQECQELENKQATDKEQAACWKRLATGGQAAAPAGETIKQSSSGQVPAMEVAASNSAEGNGKQTEKSKLLKEWDPAHEGAAIAHRQSYLLPYAHSSSPNNMPTSPNPNNQVPLSLLDNRDLKFQLSGKGALYDWKNGNSLWLAYTQQSFWQFYDTQNSRPFRENNYEPELIFSTSWVKGKISGLEVLNIGLWDHQSNGQSNPRSRSWNRMYIQPGFETEFAGGKLIVQPKIWARISEGQPTDDNPNITHYLGYGELQARFMSGEDKPKYQLSALARIRSLQLDADIPLDVIPIIKLIPNIEQSDFRAHIQYFTGYGESLLDYNQQHHTWGFGVSLPY